MKTLTTHITILVFLFLFPSVSFSQTFKCEFIQEKDEDGSSNNGVCFFDPELRGDRRNNEHCWTKQITERDIYEDYLDFKVDVDKGVVNWTRRVESSTNYRTTNRTTSEPSKTQETGKIVSFYSFPQVLQRGMNSKVTVSYIIVYTQRSKYFGEFVRTLYIPQNGKSIISNYRIHMDLFNDRIKSSSLDMRFGTCEKDS
jgi:hypothetical protein